MLTQNKLRLALKLYPLYEAVSGDLLFFSVIQTLFFTQVKGFSASQIAMIILLADIVDLAIEYPTYKVIRRLGNSRSCIIGAIMPLIGIVLITIGRSMPIVSLGMIFFVGAANFQSMAEAAARNNLVLIGEKEDYAKLFSRGNIIYSAVSMMAAIVIPFLFSINRYLPSLLCIITYAAIMAISFFIVDYSEHGGILTTLKDEKVSLVRIGMGLRFLIIVFCLFFCAGAVFTNNTEVFLSNHLSERFSEHNTIFIFGAIIWIARVVRLLSNILLPIILEKLKDRIVFIVPGIMLIAFLSVGISGLFFKETIWPIILTGMAYVIVKGVIWDPLRTFLRMTAVDTNSKNRQQSMLVYLNAGQSVVSVLMDLMVVGILKILPLEYVFIVFSVISAIMVIFAVMLMWEFKRSVEIMNYRDTFDEVSIDEISQTLYNHLINAGMEAKEALSYRLLTEEKLIESLTEKNRGTVVCVSLSTKFDDINVSLKIGDEERDIFTLAREDDLISQIIFQNVLKY